MGDVVSTLLPVTTPLSERILAAAKHHFRCPRCVICSSHIRQYREDLRTFMGQHSDVQAFVTVTVALDDGYSGGLFLADQLGNRRYLLLQPGDAVLHQWDVMHGVDVRKGHRHRWILWMHDGPPCSDGPRISWFSEARFGPLAWLQKGHWFLAQAVSASSTAAAKGFARARKAYKHCSLAGVKLCWQGLARMY